MRKISLALTLILAVTAALVSCSKDDNAPVSAVAPAPTATQTPCSDTVMFVCAATPCNASNNIFAIPVTIGASPVTTNSLALAIANVATTDSIRMALYTNHSTSNSPSILLAQSAVVPAIAGSTQVVPIPPLVLPASDVFWLAYQVSPSCMNVCWGGSGRYYVAYHPWGEFPAVAPTSSVFNGTQYPYVFLFGCD